MSPSLHRRVALPAIGLLLTSGLFLFACTESPPATAPPNAASLTVEGRSSEATALNELTRALAMGMADPEARIGLLQSFRSSKFREHKLELNAYLSSPDGQRLLGSMAERSGHGVSELTSLASLIRPLEMYMPVAAHRSSWNGDAALLVASALDDTWRQQPSRLMGPRCLSARMCHRNSPRSHSCRSRRTSGLPLPERQRACRRI
jgi:hypothetical protein